MHIQDTIEVARDFGLVDKSVRLDPAVARDVLAATDSRRKSAHSSLMTVEQIVAAWTELTIALNSINRCMGLKDTYPFVLSPAIVNKLRFVFEVISASSAKTTAA
jgi:hypothetical protein